MEEKKLPIPHSLQDLLKPEWKRNVILEDPRTSTPGLSFLLFTQAILGDGQQSFWRKFRSQWLTLAPGWDQAYQLFLKKEAPLVWSYLTSQAYQDEHSLDRGSSPRRYEALLFQEGQPVQIEGAAWIRGALKTPRDKEMAKQFFSFLLSPEAQGLIPKKNWMLPIRSDVVLPPSFKNLPVPTRLISITAKSSEIQQALTRWQLSLRE
jgi:thiamine transport system substrate-binding protein